MLQCGQGNLPSASLAGIAVPLAVPFTPLVTAARSGTLGRIPRRPWEPTTWVRGGSLGANAAVDAAIPSAVVHIGPLSSAPVNGPPGMPYS